MVLTISLFGNLVVGRSVGPRVWIAHGTVPCAVGLDGAAGTHRAGGGCGDRAAWLEGETRYGILAMVHGVLAKNGGLGHRAN